MVSLKRLSILCTAALLLAITIANAQAAFFVNGSFESATVDPNNSAFGFVEFNAGDTSIIGWIVDRDNIDYIGSYWQASNGARSIDLDGLRPGSISQTFDTVIGSTYQVGFDLAGNPDGPPTIKRLQVSAGNDSAIFQFDITGIGGCSPGCGGQSMGYQHHSFFFTATAPTSTLRFSSLSPPDGAFGPALDNVTIALAPVPEPSLSALLCIGILMSSVWYCPGTQSKREREAKRFASHYRLTAGADKSGYVRRRLRAISIRNWESRCD